MNTRANAETWRDVPPISRFEAERLIGLRTELADFLAERFKHTFGTPVEDTTVEAFPDGLSVTLVADVKPHPKYNVWGLTMSRAFAEAGAPIPVRVVVREVNELLEPAPVR